MTTNTTTAKALKNKLKALGINVKASARKADLVTMLQNTEELIDWATVAGMTIHNTPAEEVQTEEAPKTETPKTEAPKTRASKLTLEGLQAMIPDQDKAVIGGKELKVTTTDTARRKAVKFAVGKFWVVIDRIRVVTNIHLADDVLQERKGDWNPKYKISRLPLTTENAHFALANVYVEASK